MNPSRIYVSKRTLNMIGSFLSVPAFRRWGFRLVDKQIANKLEAEKRNGAPVKMREDQADMIRNMLHSANKWLDSEYVDKQTVKKLIGAFGGMIEKEAKPIVDGFKERHGFDPPRFITISPTKKCNLQCIGCYAESSADCDISLDFDTVDRMVQEQKDLWGSNFTVISGGEPFMWRSDGKGVLDLIEKHSDTFFLMYTNGTMITEKVAERMGRLGNVTPSISVEGFEEETDWRRGEGVHKKILKAFENLRKNGVLYGISITATKNNAELVFSDEFIDFYFNKHGVYYGWIFQYMPIGRAYSLELMPTAEQRVEMHKKMTHLIKNEGLFLADFWNSGTLSNGCLSAGRKGGYIYVNWDGNVMPCVFNPYSTDNIKEVYASGGTIDDIIASPFMKKIRSWQEEYYDHGGRDGGNGNILAPCPMRDHHAVMRGIIEEVGAEPTDDPAEHALEDKGYYDGMVAYGEKIASLTEEYWEREYNNGTQKPAGKKTNEKKEVSAS